MLPRLTKAQARRENQIAHVAGQLDWATARGTAQRLLGCTVSEPGASATEPIPQPECPRVAIWFEGLDLGLDIGLLVLSQDQAVLLADQVLGGTGDPATSHRALDAFTAGALSYLAARLLAALGSGLQLRAVLVDPEQLQRARAVLGAAPARRHPRVRLAGQLHRMELLLKLQPSVPSRRPARIALPALRHLPLTLCAEVGRALLRRRAFDPLRPSDILIPDGCRLQPRAGGYTGPVAMRFAGARRTRLECDASGQSLVLRRIDHLKEPVVDHAKPTHAVALDPALALGGDVPIELTVELARFTLPLEEVARLAPGAVFCTGRAIGSQVTVRAGGVPVATGELVDVDGEIGVRILCAAAPA